MTRRYIGKATILIHATERDGYLCRVTVGRKRAYRMTVWGNRGRSPEIIDGVATEALHLTPIIEKDVTVRRRKT